MGFISEFRYPSRWLSKLIIGALGLLLFTLLGTVAISSYLLYRIVSPVQSHSQINLQNFPGHPQLLAYDVAGKGSRDGWFFPGLKAAPTVILCPAYQSSRDELLTLASALQDHQYNVLLIDFSAQGSSGGRSTLGLQEVAELRSAIDAVANRGDVDASRFGLWGANLGAYIALAEATGDLRVRAIAAESPYDRPQDMVGLQITRSGLGGIPMIARMASWGFGWANYKYRSALPLSKRMGKLSGVAQLYFASEDEPFLAMNTAEIFRASYAPHELVTLQRGNYAGMQDEEKRSYENRIVSFFLTNLPATAAPPSGNSSGN